jgi:hypothetical protein
MKTIHSLSLAVAGLTAVGLSLLVSSPQVSIPESALAPIPSVDGAACAPSSAPQQRVVWDQPTPATTAMAEASIDASVS